MKPNEESGDFSLRLLAHEHCDTGESPVWDAARNCLYWIDITAGKVFRHDFETESHTCIYSGECVGGICQQEDGSLLLFRLRDAAILPFGGEPRVVLEYTDPGMERFNDVFVAPDGRVFVGTIGHDEQGGGLYRVDLDGTVTKVARRHRLREWLSHLARWEKLLLGRLYASANSQIRLRGGKWQPGESKNLPRNTEGRRYPGWHVHGFRGKSVVRPLAWARRD